MATIRLHKSLYMQQAVRDAVKVFNDFATLKIKTDGNYYSVSIDEVDPDVDGDLAGELCNFALVHTIERKRRTPK
jgi:hypothetical protein